MFNVFLEARAGIAPRPATSRPKLTTTTRMSGAFSAGGARILLRAFPTGSMQSVPISKKMEGPRRQACRDARARQRGSRLRGSSERPGLRPLMRFPGFSVLNRYSMTRRLLHYSRTIYERSDDGRHSAGGSSQYSNAHPQVHRRRAVASLLAGMMVDKFCRRSSAAPAAPMAGWRPPVADAGLSCETEHGTAGPRHEPRRDTSLCNILFRSVLIGPEAP